MVQPINFTFCSCLVQGDKVRTLCMHLRTYVHVHVHVHTCVHACMPILLYFLATVAKVLRTRGEPIGHVAVHNSYQQTI